MRLRLPDLFPQLIAKRPVFPHVSEVHKESRSGNQHAGQQKPPVALRRKTPHQPKADGHEKRRQRGQNSQRRQRIAIHRRRVVHKPPGSNRRQQRHATRDRQPPLYLPRPRRSRRSLQPVSCTPHSVPQKPPLPMPISTSRERQYPHCIEWLPMFRRSCPGAESSPGTV